MSINLKNNEINQYFGYTIYRAVPPTFCKYRLYIISRFNIKEKTYKNCRLLFNP